MQGGASGEMPGPAPAQGVGASSGRPRYIQCRSDAHLHAVLARKQRGYNRKHSSHKLEMVLFDAARQHVCRVARVLAQPRGHCLLCGLDGSGRRSVTRLAAYAQNCDLIEPDVSNASHYSLQDWREDLKNALLQSGLHGKQVAMAVLESQIATAGNQLLDDVSLLLNGGQLRSNDVLDQETQRRIQEELGPAARQAQLDKRIAAQQV